VNESLSRAYFGSEDPVGRRIRWQNTSGAWQPWQRVVGVVTNTRDVGIAQADVHVIYQATSQAVRRRGGIAGVTGGGSFPSQTILVRTTGQVRPVVRQITEIIHETDPERPVDNVITLDELRREDIAPQRLNATLFSAFAILALVVAGVGVLGVRLALGAEKGQVLRMVLGEGARLVLGALLLGGVASVMLSRLLSSLLFEIKPTDPLDIRGGGDGASRSSTARRIHTGPSCHSRRPDRRAAGGVALLSPMMVTTSPAIGSGLLIGAGVCG
jgi:ABC-type antimicrobial peptide transport system permease subunit